MLVQEINRAELRKWKRHFSLRGTKEACRQASGLTPETIARILERGRGADATLEKLRNYFITLEQQTAWKT